MNEKIYEFKLDHTLTLARRKLLEEYIEEHAPRCPWKIEWYWEDEDKILHVKSSVVKWELIFHARKLEVYGGGPFWARMLFNDKIREQLGLGIVMVLEEIGLLESSNKTTVKKLKALKKKSG